MSPTMPRGALAMLPALWLAACTRDDPPGDVPSTDTDPSETEDSGTVDTDPTPPDTATDTGTPSTDTGPDTPADPTLDAFLTGDPSSVAAVFRLAWAPEDPQWWTISGTTFRLGSRAWTGALPIPLAGVDSCEVRTGNPEATAQLERYGSVDLWTDTDGVSTTSPTRGVYVGQEELADLDPRGVVWDMWFEGTYLPFFSLADAIAMPTGELALDAPAADAAVDPAVPLEVRWHGAPADRVELQIVGGDGEVRIRCLLADDGAFDVPAAVLGHLPPGDVGLVLAAQAVAAPAAGDTGGWVQLYAEQFVQRGLTVGR